MLTSEVLLVLFVDMQPLVNFSDRQLSSSTESISVSFVHGLLIVFDALHATRLGHLDYLNLRQVLQLIFKPVSKHLIIYDDDHVDFELAGSLS